MSTHEGLGGVLATCPSCQADALTAVTDGEETNFLCDSCARCWHLDLGYVHRVDPATCPGCPRRGECLVAYARDAPPATPAG